MAERNKMKLPWSKKNQQDQAGDSRLSSEFILSAIEDGVVMVGSDNVMHIFNTAASKITGWPTNDALGLDYRNVLIFTDDHGAVQAAEANPFAKAMATNATVRDNKVMLRNRTNKLVPISIIVSPVRVGDNVSSVVGVFRDITIEKVEEQQRSDFISTASHEMRTPIAAIEGYLSLSLNPKVAQIDGRAKQYLEKAHSATEHLGQLFQDLLTSSKADDGRLSSFPEVVELGELLQQIAENARFNAQQKNLQLKYVVSGNTSSTSHKSIRPLFYAHVDPNRLREVLQNIVDNALKYTAQGSVTISLTGNDSIVQIQIQDTGQGIAEEDIPHLFQKFYRVDNSLTRSIGGTGLGLYICRKILELYNGQIWVESKLGQGSIFFINLPRLTTDQALALQKQEAVNMSTIRQATNNQQTNAQPVTNT